VAWASKALLVCDSDQFRHQHIFWQLRWGRKRITRTNLHYYKNIFYQRGHFLVEAAQCPMNQATSEDVYLETIPNPATSTNSSSEVAGVTSYL